MDCSTSINTQVKYKYLKHVRGAADILHFPGEMMERMNDDDEFSGADQWLD